MSGIVNAITGKTPKESAAVKAARARQEASLKAQEALQKRSQMEADKREEELSGAAAAQRRAIAARRRTRGDLSFGGATSTLKTQLGA